MNAADPSLLDRVRKDAGISDKLAACHTAKIEGFFIEGHVPGTDIKRLMDEKPDAIGLTVPGMPMGSPGMDKAPSPKNTMCCSSGRTARQKSLQAIRQTTTITSAWSLDNICTDCPFDTDVKTDCSYSSTHKKM